MKEYNLIRDIYEAFDDDLSRRVFLCRLSYNLERSIGSDNNAIHDLVLSNNKIA